MKKIQQGFTLIELMIVIAIIAILAAIALPAYQNYVIRSKVSEAVLAADGCKTSVAEAAQSYGHLPATASSGCTAQTTTYVSNLTWTGGVGGHIDAQVTNTNSTADTGHIILTPTYSGDNASALNWKCSTDIAQLAYVPSSCR